MNPAISRLAVAVSVVLALSHPASAAPTQTSKPDGLQRPPARTRPVEAFQQPQQIKTQPPHDITLQRAQPCIVPSLTGATSNAAQTALASANLRMGAVQNREANQARGTVIDQQPQPRTQVRCGTTVDIWVAAPVPQSGTKDGVGSGSIKGRGALGSKVGGHVGSQSGTSDGPPSAGSSGGDDVGQVSKCVVSVPDVTGRFVDDIRKVLAKSKLEVGRIGTREADRPRGFVLAQSPSSGARVACGTQVSLLVAVPVTPPPQIPPCVVPDLTGSDANEIQKRLTRADLVVGSVGERAADGSRPGTVITQQPRPGTQVQCRSQVSVVVAVAPTVQCAPVPTLTGRDTKTAAVLLESAGLRLGTIEQRESSNAVGIILEQAPAPGSKITCDTPVRIWVAVPPTGVIVPTLGGNSEAGARGALEGVGLVMGAIGRRPSDQPIGSVIEQSPAAGTLVKPGSPVQVWLATPVPVTVPDLRGQDRATATGTLTSARLRLGPVSDRSSDRTAGTVVEQTPAPGTQVVPGASVQIWLAVPPPVTVPDVRGQTRDTASDTLTTAKLRLGDTSERESDRTAGTIVDQTPAPGTSVQQATAVQLVLAVPQPVTVPDLRGQNRGAALESLAAARLRLGDTSERESDRAVGTILDQTPAAGTKVRPGTAVQVALAVPQPATVPNLRGQDRAKAADMLARARLRLGDVSERPSDRTAGTVIDQSPGAGTVVRPGTAVQVALAVEPPPTVPDLRGQDRGSATDALTTAHLRLGQIAERPSELAAGTVVDQIPAAGTSAAAGTEVQVWLAVPILIEVPDVAGRTQLEADRLMRDRGLAIGATTQETSTSTAGTILRQLPVAGARVASGTAVDVVVAAAAPPVAAAVTLIAVPDLFGRSEPDARGILLTAGLQSGNISRVRSLVARATITGQFPRPGAQVAPNAPIDLEIASLDLALLGMLGAGIALGAAAAGIVSQARRGGGRLTPEITLAPHADSGVQTIPDDHALPSSELSLQGFRDAGTQSILASAALVLDVSSGTR